MKLLRGDVYDVHAELAQLQKEADDNENRKTSVFDLVRLPIPRKALFICFAGMIFQQLSGINAVLFFMSKIFEAANSTLPAGVDSTLVALVQVGL